MYKCLSDDDSVVSTTFSVNVNAYLLPDVFDNKTTILLLTNEKSCMGNRSRNNRFKFFTKQRYLFNINPARSEEDLCNQRVHCIAIKLNWI